MIVMYLYWMACNAQRLGNNMFAQVTVKEEYDFVRLRF